MKKLLLIGLVLLLVGGGAAWWFVLRAPEETAEAAAEPSTPTFVDLDPMTVPVVRNAEVKRYVRVDLALEVAGPEAAEAVQKDLPRLNDALVTVLYSLLGRRQMEERRYSLEIIKRHLQEAADRTFGTGEVLAILVQGMAQADTR